MSNAHNFQFLLEETDFLYQNLFAVFSKFASFILQSLLYKKVQDSQVRSNLANELMIYHMQASSDQSVYECHQK